MHVWPAKVVTPSLTYEAVVVMSNMEGDVEIAAQNGTILETLTGCSYVREDDSFRITYDGGTAIATKRQCGCGGSRSYETAPDAVPV